LTGEHRLCTYRIRGGAPATVKELTSPAHLLTPCESPAIGLRVSGGVHPEREAHPALRFDEIYGQHLRFVWRVLRAFGVRPAALEDAAQDVFVVVHRRLPTFEQRSQITTWLFGIAMRVARDHRLPKTSPAPIAEVEEGLRDDGPSPFEITARREAGCLLERLVDELDEEKRVPFVLIDIEQMTAHEVADLLGIKLNTVYSRLRHARAEFNRLVARRERSGR
jgi:RNA polymerase sigma-70 factor, ECF subfamily